MVFFRHFAVGAIIKSAYVSGTGPGNLNSLLSVGLIHLDTNTAVNASTKVLYEPNELLN